MAMTQTISTFDKSNPGSGAYELTDFPIPKTDLIVVGYSPGNPEYHDRLPRRQWRITRHLENWLTRAGFPEGAGERAPLTNLWPYYAPDNVVSQAMIDANRPWLDQQILESEPRMVLMLGETVANELAGKVVNRSIKLYHEVGRRPIYVAGPRGPIFLVTLPHPSGRSRFLNDDLGKRLLEMAIGHMDRIRQEFQLTV